jgi:hypothetical protein
LNRDFKLGQGGILGNFSDVNKSNIIKKARDYKNPNSQLSNYTQKNTQNTEHSELLGSLKNIKNTTLDRYLSNIKGAHNP